MWDLFDFNNDGKVSLEEKVIGTAIAEELLFSDDNGRIEDSELNEDFEKDSFDSDGSDDDEI